MKAIISLSGGMDSVTMLAEALSQGREVSCIGFTYGSKHNQFENKAAEKVAEHYKVPLRLLDLTQVMNCMKSNLLKTGGDIPLGHYEDESMSRTVVPGRNLILLSVLTGIAWTEGVVEVWFGMQSGDFAVYPDCRPDFVEAMRHAMLIGSDNQVILRTPFLYDNKTTIIKRGLELEVPYELTRTCYQDQELSCGKCGACVERLEAFANNGLIDPIGYVS